MLGCARASFTFELLVAMRVMGDDVFVDSSPALTICFSSAVSVAPELVQSPYVIAPVSLQFASCSPTQATAPCKHVTLWSTYPLDVGPWPCACISCQSSHPAAGSHRHGLHPIHPVALKLAPVAHIHAAGYCACSLCQPLHMQ